MKAHIYRLMSGRNDLTHVHKRRNAKRECEGAKESQSESNTRDKMLSPEIYHPYGQTNGRGLAWGREQRDIGYLAFYLLVDTSITFAVIVGFLMTSSYQQIYIYTLRGFKGSFTYGEASVFVQGLVLFATSAIHQLGGFLCGGSWPTDEFETLNMIMVVGIEEI